MTDIEVAIDLIVPDNTAYTVLVTLRRLGFETLERVARSEVYRLGVDAQPGDLEQIVAKLTHAEVLFNPNKHRLSYALTSGSPASTTNGAAEWEALVTEREDDTSGLVRLLQGPFEIRTLKTLTRGIAWRLYEKDAPASQSRLEWACRELLANPYSQSFVVRPLPLRAPAKA